MRGERIYAARDAGGGRGYQSLVCRQAVVAGNRWQRWAQLRLHWHRRDSGDRAGCNDGGGLRAVSPHDRSGWGHATVVARYRSSLSPQKQKRPATGRVRFRRIHHE